MEAVLRMSWEQLELSQETLAQVHVEAMRRGLGPEEFLRVVLAQWSDAHYSGTPVPRGGGGYSGLGATG